MLSKTFAVMMILSFVSALLTGNVENFGVGFAESLSEAVGLCISLLGMMCFWSGLMNVLREAGVLRHLSKITKPLAKLVFGSSVKNETDVENISASAAANFLGLGNAALPLGINSVKGLQCNNKSQKANDGVIMFAVLSTVPFQLLPSTLIALRSKYGSVNPYDVVPFIWLCSIIINVFAVFVCKIMAVIWRDKS